MGLILQYAPVCCNVALHRVGMLNSGPDKRCFVSFAMPCGLSCHLMCIQCGLSCHLSPSDISDGRPTSTTMTVLKNIRRISLHQTGAQSYLEFCAPCHSTADVVLGCTGMRLKVCRAVLAARSLAGSSTKQLVST